MNVLAYAENIKLFDVVQVYDTAMMDCEEYLAVQLHVDCGFSFRSRWRLGNMYKIDEGDEAKREKYKGAAKKLLKRLDELV